MDEVMTDTLRDNDIVGSSSDSGRVGAHSSTITREKCRPLHFNKKKKELRLGHLIE